MKARGFLFILIAASAAFLLRPREAFARSTHLDVTASAAERYDDNVTFAESGEVRDFISRLSLGVGVDHEGARQRVKLMAGIHQELFASHGEFNNLSENVDLSWQADLTKHSRLTFKEAFSHADEPRSFQDTLGRVSGRYSTLRNRVNLQWKQEITQQFALITRYANEINEFSTDAVRDSFFHSAGLQAEYALSSETFALGSYDFGFRDFQSGDDALSHTLTAGLRQYFTPAVFVEGRAGFDVLKDFSGNTSTHPRLQASLNHEIDGESLASAAIDQTFETTSYEASVFKSWRASLTYRRQLAKRLSGSTAAFYGESEYLSSNVKDNVSGLGFALNYELSPDWTTGVGYRFSNVSSSADAREYLKNVVMLNVEVKL